MFLFELPSPKPTPFVLKKSFLDTNTVLCLKRRLKSHCNLSFRQFPSAMADDTSKETRSRRLQRCEVMSLNELRRFYFFFQFTNSKLVLTQANVYLTHWVLSFRRQVTISTHELLPVFTVVFTMRNPAKTYRPKRTTVKCHAYFARCSIYPTVAGDRSELS